MKGIKMGATIWGLVGLVLLVGSGLVYARYLRDLRSFEQRLADIDSRVIETACGPVEYTEYGSGFPLLVIHGNGGGLDQGLMLARAYVGSGFRVIAPSRFGYLGTPLPEDASVEAQADAYACLLDELGIRQAGLLTSSAGVTAVVQFALRHPQRAAALILHSPNSPGEVGLQAPPRAAFSALLRSDFAYWAATTAFGSQMQALVGVPRSFTLTPEFQAEVDQTLRGVLPSSRRADGMIFDTYVGNPAINEIPLEQVTTPTLVITAVDDPMTLHERALVLAERIPGAQVVKITDGGHMMLGHAEEVREAIDRFMAGLPGKAAAGAPSAP